MKTVMHEINILHLIKSKEYSELFMTIDNMICEEDSLTLDFSNVTTVNLDKANLVFNACIRARARGNTIRIKNMSLPLKSYYLIAGLGKAGDDFIL